MAITNEVKVIIAATATKLLFGLRDYKLALVDRVIVYPKAFKSAANANFHKGEFNPGYRALVFSWYDVVDGYANDSDNLNLAIHEFVHAIHLTFLNSRRTSTSAAIFLDSFVELTKMLDDDDYRKQSLIDSGYFRDYAFTNQYEFLAVLIESFIETPYEFRQLFPEVYGKVRQMLNFNFKGY